MASQPHHPNHYSAPPLPASVPALIAFGATEQELANAECMAVMEDIFGPTATYQFLVESAFKYVWRAGKKGPADLDYEKASQCLAYAAELECVRVSPEYRAMVEHAARLVPDNKAIKGEEINDN